MRKPYPKNRKSSPRTGVNKGVPKPPIDRTCAHCGGHYIGYNGTRYCSDRCVLMGHLHVEGGCWLWTGYIPKTGHRAGYGEFDFKSGKRMLAHRAAFLLLRGEDPGKRLVCHSCDTPACCNPEHLWLGTTEENMADRNAKGRQARGERNGPAKLTETDVRMIRADPRGCRLLAKAYGVHVGTILSIRAKRTWKHVA